MLEINANKYFDWIKAGRSFQEIRKDLQIRGFSDDQITTILEAINDWILQSNVERERYKISNQWKWIGWSLIGINICLTVYSYWVSAYTFTIFSIGGIISGWGLLSYVERMQRPTLFQSRFKNRRRNY